MLEIVPCNQLTNIKCLLEDVGCYSVMCKPAQQKGKRLFNLSFDILSLKSYPMSYHEMVRTLDIHPNFHGYRTALKPFHVSINEQSCC